MAFLTTLAKTFAEGLAKGAGEATGTNIVNGIFGALGFGNDGGSEQNHKDLQEISGKLTEISSKLDNVVQELIMIAQNQRKQLEQAKLDHWMTTRQGPEPDFTRIYTLWSQAMISETDRKYWVESVLGDGHMERPVKDCITNIQAKLNTPDNFLSAYADLLIYRIELSFPVLEPWQPAFSFIDYCGYILQNYWYAATMAKTANLFRYDDTHKKDDKYKNEAISCVNLYLTQVESFERVALPLLVRIIAAMNKKIDELGQSFPIVYDPFFTIEEFHFFDTWHPEHPWAADRYAIKEDISIQQLDNHELVKFKDDQYKYMGKDIEMLDELFSTYRPTSAYGKSEGRINLYLSFWNNFYQGHKDSLRLDNVELIDDNTGEKIKATGGLNNMGLRLYINLNPYYFDERFNPEPFQSIYNTRDTDVYFQRWVFFVPFGKYKVDEGGRYQWTHKGATFTFMGKSSYHTEGVSVTPAKPAQIIRWSPWNGAYKLAETQLGFY